MKSDFYLTGVLILAIAALCNAQEMDLQLQEKVQIKWYLQLSNDEADPHTTGLNAYVEQYNNSQDRIELNIVPSYAGCSFDATDSLLRMINEGNPPDIFAYRYSEVWEHLLDLTPYLSAYDLSQVDSAYFFKYKINKRLLYVNLGVYPFVLYYNKDLFDSAGIAYPPHEYGANYADGDAWDMNKFKEIAMKLTLDSNKRNALDSDFDNNQIEQYGFHWEWANGLSFINSFGFPGIVNSDSIISVPEYMREGYKWTHKAIWEKQFIPPMEVFESMNFDPLGSGKVAMCWDHGDNDSINWDMAVMPSYNGELNLPWGDMPFGILNTCEHPEEAMEVIFTIANTIDFYGSAIPVFKNLRPAAYDSLIAGDPDVDWQVLYDGLNQIEDVNSNYAWGLHNNMTAWRLANEMRNYILSDKDANVDGALDTYFIPRWEELFKKEEPVITEASDIDTDKSDNIEIAPNPVFGNASVSFQVNSGNSISLKLYDLCGRELKVLKIGFYEAGNYSVSIPLEELANGYYFICLDQGDKYETESFIVKK